MPVRSTEMAGGLDLFMPEDGVAYANQETKIGLGFAATVPYAHVGLILPRSGVGSKFGLELNNTCGVIDHDYTGEWIATLKLKRHEEKHWVAGDRLLQVIVVPVAMVTPRLVLNLNPTGRGEGGLGSTGA